MAPAAFLSEGRGGRKRQQGMADGARGETERRTVKRLVTEPPAWSFLPKATVTMFVRGLLGAVPQLRALHACFA